MKVNTLELSNYKSIRHIVLQPLGNNMILSGKNGAGKTAIMEALQILLNIKFGNKKQLPDGDLVRQGTESAMLKADFGDGNKRSFTITRNIRSDGTLSLLVNPYSEDGKKLKGVQQPAQFLKNLIGDITLDLKTLREGSDADLLELIYNKVPGLKEEMEKIDKQISDIMENRKEINVQIKHVRSDLDRTPLTPDLPEKEVEPAELMQKMQNARDHNEMKDRWEIDIQNIVSDMENESGVIDEARREIEEYKEKIEKLYESIKSSEKKRKKLQEEREAVSDKIKDHKPIDTEPIQKEINSLNETNDKIKQNSRHKELASQVEEKRKQYQALGDKIKTVESNRLKIVTDAQLPVPGLTIIDGSLKYPHPESMDMVNIKSLSDGEFWPLALELCATTIGEIRVILVKSYNDLDKDNEALLLNAAKDKNIQIIAHNVIKEEAIWDGFGFLIKDGELEKAGKVHP